MLGIQKLLFWSPDLCLHAILHLLYKFPTNRPKWHRNIDEEKFQYGDQPPSWICKIRSIFCQMTILGIEIHICQPNLIEIGWFAAEIWEIKLLSKWRPSAILNFRKLQFWSRDLHRRVILHLLSKFRINRPLWYRDIAKKPVVHVLQRLIWTGTLPWSENRTYSADCHLVVFPYWTQICTSFTILTVINIIIY